MATINDKAARFREKLIFEISVGSYPAGSKLPGERTFCQRYRISRTTVRKSLDGLERAGIIFRRPPVGAFVSDNALDIISRLATASPAVKVAFWLPAAQVRNSLFNTIFVTCRNNLPANINVSILFREHGMPYDFAGEKYDMAIVHIPECGELLQNLKRNTECVVLLNSTNLEYNYISANNYSGGKIMAKYLLAKGHKMVASIGSTGGGEGSDFEQRLKGIKDTCAEAGAKLEHHSVGGDDFSRLTQVCLTWLKKVRIKHPDLSAVMVLQDMIAIHIYEAAKQLGIKIPDDISVIGFDDQYYAASMAPPLVTVKYPAEALGLALSGFIADWMENRSNSLQKAIEPLLMERKEGGSVKRILS